MIQILPLMLGLALLPAAAGLAQDEGSPAASPQLAEVSFAQDPLLDIPRPQAQLAYSLVIDNRRGGTIRIVDPPATFLFNRPGVDLGKVIQPVRRLRTDIPEAQLPSPANVVCYSGSDAIHVKGWNAGAYENSAVISILPADNERYLPEELAAKWDSIPGNALITDIPAGSGIFGGAYPVIVGNPVNVYRGTNILDFSPLYADIEVGDRIVIGVHVPVEWPDDLRIPNQAGAQVEWNLAGQELLLARTELAMDGPRLSGLAGPMPAAGISLTDSTSFMVGVPGGEGRLCFAANAQGFGSRAGIQLVNLNELALPWQAPLFSGYLYPFNPLDPPAKLPLPVIRVRLGNGSSWVPLASVIEPGALQTVTSIRIDWLPVGSADEGKVISETPQDLEIGPAK